jgi:phage-related protein
MKEIGPGVAEIRIHARGEYRVFYVARFSDALYVLHAFHKQTQQTPRREIEIAERQYAQLRRFRKKREDS